MYKAFFSCKDYTNCNNVCRKNIYYRELTISYWGRITYTLLCQKKHNLHHKLGLPFWVAFSILVSVLFVFFALKLTPQYSDSTWTHQETVFSNKWGVLCEKWSISLREWDRITLNVMFSLGWHSFICTIHLAASLLCYSKVFLSIKGYFIQSVCSLFTDTC